MMRMIARLNAVALNSAARPKMMLAAPKLLGDLQGWCPSLGQPLAGLAVQGAADAACQVPEIGIADQLMAEVQPVAVVFQHAGPDRLAQHHGQVDGGAAGHRSQVGGREA